MAARATDNEYRQRTTAIDGHPAPQAGPAGRHGRRFCRQPAILLHAVAPGCADRRWPARDLQPDAADRVRCPGERQRERSCRRAALRIRVQQVQRLARSQGIADVGRLQAAYMLAPLVMDLADSGCRSRSSRWDIARVRSSWCGPIRRTSTSRNSAGKRIAIPSRFAVDYLFLRKMLTTGGHDAQGRRDRGDGAARHAGGALRAKRWMPTAPASPSGRRRSAPAMRGLCA